MYENLQFIYNDQSILLNSDGVCCKFGCILIRYREKSDKKYIKYLIFIGPNFRKKNKEIENIFLYKTVFIIVTNFYVFFNYKNDRIKIIFILTVKACNENDVKLFLIFELFIVAQFGAENFKTII